MAGHYFKEDAAMLAGSSFALGVVTGLLLHRFGKEMLELLRVKAWHHGYERTVTYDENLPDTLGRREPPPEPGQPRYGGTGAIGVHPSAAGK